MVTLKTNMSGHCCMGYSRGMLIMKKPIETRINMAFPSRKTKFGFALATKNC